MFQESLDSKRTLGKKLTEFRNGKPLSSVAAEADGLSLNGSFEEGNKGVTTIPVVIEAAEEFELVHLFSGDDIGTVQVRLDCLLNCGKVGLARINKDVVDIEEDSVELQTVTAPREADEKSFEYLAKIPWV